MKITNKFSKFYDKDILPLLFWIMVCSFLFAIAINFIVSIKTRFTEGDTNAWISFWGSLGGGFLTLAGVGLTLQHNRKLSKQSLLQTKAVELKIALLDDLRSVVANILKDFFVIKDTASFLKRLFDNTPESKEEKMIFETIDKQNLFDSSLKQFIDFIDAKTVASWNIYINSRKLSAESILSQEQSELFDTLLKRDDKDTLKKCLQKFVLLPKKYAEGVVDASDYGILDKTIEAVEADIAFFEKFITDLGKSILQEVSKETK